MLKIIREIQSQIESGELASADHLKHNVVCRIVQILGWDIWDPNEVRCQSSISGYKSSETVSLCFQNKAVAIVLIDENCRTKEDMRENNRQKIVRMLSQSDIHVLVAIGSEWWIIYANYPTATLRQKEVVSFSFLSSPVDTIRNALIKMLSRYQVCSGNALLSSAIKDARVTSIQTTEIVDEKVYASDYVSYVSYMAELNTAFNPDNDDELAQVFLKSQAYYTPEQLAYQLFFRQELRFMLFYLTPNERVIVCLRFGLLDHSACTLEEISTFVGKTRERIRQMLLRIMNKLRFYPRLDELVMYYRLGFCS